MSNTKLTLWHIVHFLPYELKVKTNNIIRLLVLEPGFNLTTITVHSLLNGIGHKPIVRRLDLTKPITINGEEKIPIVELAKISFPKHQWFFDGTCAIAGGIGNSIYFNYCLMTNCFFSGNETPYHVEFQPQLFQWLYENKFNIDIPDELVIYTDEMKTDIYNS